MLLKEIEDLPNGRRTFGTVDLKVEYGEKTMTLRENILKEFLRETDFVFARNLKRISFEAISI